MSGSLAITGARIFDGEAWHDDATLAIQDGRIEALGKAGSADALRLEGGLLVPGFVDLQVNGGGGVLLNDTPTLEGIRRICAAHAHFGTTALLPTLITDTSEITRQAVAAGVQAWGQKVPGFLGLHLEGPHLSLARKGAHDPALIRPMEEADFVRLSGAAAYMPVLLTTVAPETVPAEQIARLAAAGVRVSIGHSDSSFPAAGAAIEAGASLVTHLFNAMSPLAHRDPGMVGAALESPTAFAGLIADGFHVDPHAIAIALRAKRGPGRIFLVTDAMATIGTQMTEFTLNGRRIRRAGGRLTLEDGTLAGADLDMISAVRFMHREIGVSLDEALRMASLYPAQAVGQEGRLGRLLPGHAACVVHLSDDLDVRRVWIDGTEVGTP